MLNIASRLLFIHPVQKSTDVHQTDEQVLIMNNERFTIPEILFHPSDIGKTVATRGFIISGVSHRFLQA